MRGPMFKSITFLNHRNLVPYCAKYELMVRRYYVRQTRKYLGPTCFAYQKTKQKSWKLEVFIIKRPIRFLQHEVVLFGKNVSEKPDACINVSRIGRNHTA